MISKDFEPIKIQESKKYLYAKMSKLKIKASKKLRLSDKFVRLFKKVFK